MSLLLQLVVNGLVNGAMYAVLAVGFGVVWRSLKVFHIAYAGLYVLCAHFFWLLAAKTALGVVPALVISLALAGISGWLLELAVYRPFYKKKASNGAVLIASLGVFIVIENSLAMWLGDELHAIPRDAITPWVLGSIVGSSLQVLQFVVGVSVIGFLMVSVRCSNTFKALWAMGDQPRLVSVLGLPLYLLRSLALILSTILVCVAASLITLDTGTDVHMGMSYLLIAAVAVLIGGRDSLAGWVCGAFLLALLQSVVIWQFSARWTDLVTFGLLIVILIFRPQGLFNSRKRVEEPA
ncbi:MAG: branched-chain amino acid ABC transporter permease [Verrucomicrobiota bacterium]